ncbi:hypothetical protein ALI22I_02890 [Saccharothrix sp. ALI-22-I]|nr:hypothetical protein ALI22I_02890 [Saccharothrix sp. ALI-22-I]
MVWSKVSASMRWRSYAMVSRAWVLNVLMPNEWATLRRPVSSAQSGMFPCLAASNVSAQAGSRSSRMDFNTTISGCGMRPSGVRRPRPARWDRDGRKPVHQMMASAERRTSESIGRARRSPRSRASRTGGTMTMSPSAPTPPGLWVAMSNSALPSISSGR